MRKANSKGSLQLIGFIWKQIHFSNALFHYVFEIYITFKKKTTSAYKLTLFFKFIFLQQHLRYPRKIKPKIPRTLSKRERERMNSL